MSITPLGEKGKTIQLKRTSLPYNNADVIAEQLNYGEPLYNDGDKTLLIGDNASTTNDNLKIIKAVDRTKANSQVYMAGSGSSTLDSATGMANLYSENNTTVYVKEKNWGDFSVPVNATTYSYTVNSSNNIVPGAAQGSSFETLPCLVQINVSGMKSTYKPTISLSLSRDESSSTDMIKSLSRSFSCIGRCDSAANKLYLIFIKKPSSTFKISVTGG